MTIKCLSLPSSVDGLWPPAPVTQEVRTTQNVAFYKCKHCDRVKPGSCANFSFSDLDRSIKCDNRNCLKRSMSRDWKCACEENWYACAQHAKHVTGVCQPTQSHGPATGQTVNSESSKRKATKEPALDFESLLQDDLRRGRKRMSPDSVITLGDRAEPPQRQYKYGVILSERFGTSSSSRST